MFSTLKTAALAAIIGLGSLAPMPAAHADGVYFSFGQNGATFGVNDRGRHRGPGWDRHDRGPRWDRHRPRPAACSPGEAVRKAQRMGLRNTRVIREDRRAIHVAGRSYRDRGVIVFARAPNCPVIRSL